MLPYPSMRVVRRRSRGVEGGAGAVGDAAAGGLVDAVADAGGGSDGHEGLAGAEIFD